MARLGRLRQWRNRPDPDLSLGFLAGQVERQIQRPARQLERVVPAWRVCVPEPLLGVCRLESYQRGVLAVAVPSSSHRYELDGLLRSGLQNELTRRLLPLTVRKVRIRVDPGLLAAVDR